MLGTLYQYHPHHLRSPLHSRHRPPTHRPCEQTTSPSLELDAPTSRFPISSIRPEAPQNCSPDPPIDPPKLVYPRYDPLYVLSCPSTPMPHLPSLPSYAHVSPNPAPSVAPGVLADGVLTAMLPDVKDFLAEAAIAPPACPQFPTDERVLALAALSVFYKPLHPAHWVFWNREQKKATAAIVQSVLDTIPSPIISPIGWIAIPENLWILASMQHAYASRLATLPWYAAYMSTEPEPRMNLRKRKPPPIMSSDGAGATGPAGATASGEETADEDEAIIPPPRKRARTRRAAATREQTNTPMQAAARHTPGVIKHATPDAEPGHGHAAPEAQPQPELGANSLLLLAPVDPSVSSTSTPSVAAKQEIIDGAVRDDVHSAPVDATEDIPQVRRSPRNSPANGTSAFLSTPSSTSGSLSRPRTRATASPLSVASTLTPQIGARGLSTPLSRHSPSSSAGSAAGSTSGSSTVVGLCDEVTKCANKVTFSAVPAVVTKGIVEAEEEIAEPPAKVSKRSRAKTTRSSRGSRALSKAVKEKKEIATAAEVTTKSTGAVQARSKARAKTRKC